MSERADARADRLKAALRENLKRRKVQVRERGEADAPQQPVEESGTQRGEGEVLPAEER